MKTALFNDLPTERTCNHCGETKPREEMVITRLHTEGIFYMRPKCKACHNKRERGHRRDYKAQYLQNWRKKNAEVNKSYWSNAEQRERARLRAAARSEVDKNAIAIQRRFLTQGVNISIHEAREYLAQYGRCYPTRFGLTPRGLAECERIRSRLRSRNVDRRRRQSAFEIRLMVYEEGGIFVIQPDQQPIPYAAAAERMRNYQRQSHSRSMEAPV